MSPAKRRSGNRSTEADLMQPSLGFPDSPIKLMSHRDSLEEELRGLVVMSLLCDRVYMGIMSQCDDLRFRTCREIEGPFADYVGNKPVRQICIAFRTSYTRAMVQGGPKLFLTEEVEETQEYIKQTRMSLQINRADERLPLLTGKRSNAKMLLKQ
ncbi:hypothetical protein D5086_024948 [Populus alba]|uniref:Uncharacterized protein n=1 Tax=Populus alba TaxID=43335 RepID=A0ACC4B755_POPAL